MAISNMRYDSAVHIHLQSRTRFWVPQNLSGFANTDLPIRNILHDTEGQPGVRGIMGIETAGLNAQLAAKMSSEDRLRWAMENLVKIFPEISSNFEGGTSVVWDQEPWSLGCSAYYAPGEMTVMFPHVGMPEGRVHFAGEHTSLLYVMEGAAQSGVRVVEEINRGLPFPKCAALGFHFSGKHTLPRYVRRRQSQNPPLQKSSAIPALPWPSKPRLRYSPGLAPTTRLNALLNAASDS